MKFDIVASDDIKIYYTGKSQGFTARYIIKACYKHQTYSSFSRMFLRGFSLDLLELEIVKYFKPVKLLPDNKILL